MACIEVFMLMTDTCHSMHSAWVLQSAFMFAAEDSVIGTSLRHNGVWHLNANSRAGGLNTGQHQ